MNLLSQGPTTYLTFWVGHEFFGESCEKYGPIFQAKYV